MTSHRVALCLYGLPRSVARTALWIRDCLLAPLRQHGAPLVLPPFYERSAEAGEPVAATPADLLPFDGLHTEAPFETLDRGLLALPRAHGGYRRDGGVSLRNLVLRLHSLRRVTGMALAEGGDRCLFARPGLLSHHSLPLSAKALLTASGAKVRQTVRDGPARHGATRHGPTA